MQNVYLLLIVTRTRLGHLYRDEIRNKSVTALGCKIMLTRYPLPKCGVKPDLTWPEWEMESTSGVSSRTAQCRPTVVLALNSRFSLTFPTSDTGMRVSRLAVWDVVRSHA